MKKIVLALSILTVLLYACKDEDVISTPDLVSTQATQDHLLAEQIFNDVGCIVEEGFQYNNQSKSCLSYILINADTLDIDTLVIDFGEENCLNNGKLRKGKIIITYTGRYRDSLSVMTTSFENYHVNNNLVQGERIVRNQGRNNNGNMWFTVEVNNASINTSNGTINWESIQEREWVEGSMTLLNIFDDIYSITTGSASGNNRIGNSFTMTITDPLTVDLKCLLYGGCIVKSGEAKISPNNYSDRIINYGDSLCDCNFFVTINEESYLIVIN